MSPVIIEIHKQGLPPVALLVMPKPCAYCFLLLVVLLFRAPLQSADTATQSNPSAVPIADSGPVAVVASPDSHTLYLACALSREVLVLDADKCRIIRTLPVPEPPSGLALSSDGSCLFVTCASATSPVCVFNPRSGQLLYQLQAGHTALCPVLGPDHKSLFVCNRFNDAISVFDVTQRKEVARIPVSREPVSTALTPDGCSLLVANHLPRGRSDVSYVAATINVIDVRGRRTTKELRLPNGSILLRQFAVSPEGRYACVPHSIGRFQLPVTQIQRGWVNTSALTLVDLARMEVLNSILLDDPDQGAANPWAAGWSPDGRWLCVTHAGTHQLSIIDFPALLKKLEAANPKEVPNDLAFLQGIRRRIKLGSLGPRALALVKDRAYVAGYFSDSLDIVCLDAPDAAPEHIPLHVVREMNQLRRGEMYFNDASICFQGWQSCASCHDDDARVDGLNWDLLNDGIGNPKDTKSLLLSHQTPPVMSLGIRATAALAVRAGIGNSLETKLPEEVASAMDAWLSSLQPMPSPYLVNGHLSESAQRGEKLFKSAEVGCATCHEPGLFTDLHSYDVGTSGPFDKQDKEFDTPTLRELWRTAPYLHDGSAPTLRDVLTSRNPTDQHGKTSQLLSRQLDDLIQYVLSL